MPISQLSLVLLWLLPVTVTASLLPSHEKIDGWLNALGADGQFDPDKGLDWGIIPGPFYTPELGVGLGAALAGLYRPDWQDTQSQNSTLTISGFTSSTGAFGLALENRTFLAADHWRLFADAYASNTPSYYWGKGYAAGHNSNNAQGYTARTFILRPTVMYRLFTHVYLAADWSLNSFHVSQIKTRDNGSITEDLSRSVFSSAPGISLSYDSRDSVSYPTRGVSAKLQYSNYSPATGSDSRFNDMSTSISWYHSLSPRQVLALETSARFTQGQVPWNMLPTLGDSQHMRGYYQGRYRDNNLLSGQLEFRQKLSWRHGLVFWLGAGTMSEHVSQIVKGSWLPTVGVGYRFEIKPDINIRLDYGIGKGSTGFYFQLGEAF